MDVVIGDLCTVETFLCEESALSIVVDIVFGNDVAGICFISRIEKDACATVTAALSCTGILINPVVLYRGCAYVTGVDSVCRCAG